MKTVTILLSLAILALAVSLFVAGIQMIIVGTIGHVFDITTYRYLSFWEVYILTWVFGLFGGLLGRG